MSDMEQSMATILNSEPAVNLLMMMDFCIRVRAPDGVGQSRRAERVRHGTERRNPAAHCAQRVSLPGLDEMVRIYFRLPWHHASLLPATKNHVAAVWPHLREA